MILRLIAIGDALSQLLNVALLPNFSDTNANESISGRAYRSGWTKTQKVIDWVFSPFEKQHCRKAYFNDLTRASSLIESAKR